MASIPELPAGSAPDARPEQVGAGAAAASRDGDSATGRSLADLQSTRALPVPAALAILDGVLGCLAVLEAQGRHHGHVDAQTIIISRAGEVALGEPRVGTVAAAGNDVTMDTRSTVRLFTPLVSGGGRRMQRVVHLLEAVVEGRAASSPADVRAQLGSAAAPLGPGWNDPRRLVELIAATTPTTAQPRRHHRRRWLLSGSVALVVAALVVVVLLLVNGGGSTILNSGPLTVGGNVAVHVRPATGGCNTTFIFDATGTVTGSGALVYRWEQSDGYVTANSTIMITPSDGSFDLTQAWRIQGGQTLTGRETFHVLSPVDRAVTQSFGYHCP